MKTNEYMRIFISGKGKESLRIKKRVEKKKNMIIVSRLDEADILILPQEITKEIKSDMLYARELGIDIKQFAEIEKRWMMDRPERSEIVEEMEM